MDYRALLLSIPLLLAVSCASVPEATALPTPTSTPAPTPAAGLLPGDTPAPTPTPTSPITPTNTLPAALAAATSTPAPPSTPPASGRVAFRDNLAVADQLIANLVNLPAPPPGQTYQAWLIRDEGAATSVGVLDPTPDGAVTLEWNSPDSENLLNRYARFQVSLEPAGTGASPTGPIVLAGGLEGEALANARRLFVRNDGEPATPRNTALALGLKAQTDVAVQHVQNAVNAAAIGALPEMRVHLEHVVNILEGAAGPRFGDHDGNGVAEDPGDGFGVKGYAGQVAALLSNQPAVAEAAGEIPAQSTAIQDRCLQILALQDMAAAVAQLGELQALADQLKTGPVVRLYQAAQQATSFQVAPPN